MRARILVLPFLLALGACGSDAGSGGYVARVDAPTTTPVSGADASLMMAQMPAPGGLVTSVREKTYPNGVMQQAVLESGATGQGENHLEISVQTGPGSGLNIGRPSQDGIRREIIARYPKVEMRIVTQPRQNALGVFGLAIGRAASGARCVFAWQWIDDIRGGAGSSGGGMFGFGGGKVEGGAPASIRVHLCRKDATVDDLAATVEGMTLAAPAVIARALDPSRRVAETTSARENRTGSIAVASNAPEGSLESALAPQKNIAVASSDRPRQRTRVARRRAPVQPTNEAVVERTPPAVAEPAYGGGPRYLAPVAGGPSAGQAPVVYNNPAPIAAVAAPPARQLDPSLPAAAYRGPGYRAY